MNPGCGPSLKDHLLAQILNDPPTQLQRSLKSVVLISYSHPLLITGDTLKVVNISLT